MPSRLRSIFIEIISALLIFLFVYTAISKIITHNSFEAVLHESSLLKEFSNILSWLIPGTEILISILLFFPRFRNIGLLFSALLLTAFTGYIGYMILFTPKLPCSCGGVLKNLDWKMHIIFN